MKRWYLVFFFLLLVQYNILAQVNQYPRYTVLQPATIGGFGNVVAGVDLDKDGKPEIFAVSNNNVDRPEEMAPIIIKYELNGTTWDSVWSADLGFDIPLQNTWPALTYGDLDGDGRGEIIWGPVNNLDATTNPNPKRIVVFEYPNDGTENMGVSDGFGGFKPNAWTSLVDSDMVNIRPIKFVAQDIDGDGKQEIIFADRAGNSYGMYYGVVSVSNIPNDGNGSEIWNIKSSGKGDPNFASAGNQWDVAVLNNFLYTIGADGRTHAVKYENGNFISMPAQSGIAGGGSSFKGSVVTDINNDGTKEIIVGQWFANGADSASVYLLKQVGDSLVSYKICSPEHQGILRFNGCDAGDIDGDGFPEIILGTRNPASPNDAIWCIKYKGGDITSPASYTSFIIDSLLLDVGGDMDIVSVGNLDGDAAKEVTYTQGYTRGNANDLALGIPILDKQFTQVSGIKGDVNNVPQTFYISQNFPNPFNPTTNIVFGLKNESSITLKIYDVLGREVKTLINNQVMKAGTYTYNFDGKNLSSGTYLYRITAGDFVATKKMILMK